MNTLLWWLAQNMLTVAALILVVSLAARWFRHRPALVHAMWLLVLIKFVMPPLVCWPWSIADVRATFALNAVVASNSPGSPVDAAELDEREIARANSLEAIAMAEQVAAPSSELTLPSSREPGLTVDRNSVDLSSSDLNRVELNRVDRNRVDLDRVDRNSVKPIRDLSSAGPLTSSDSRGEATSLFQLVKPLAFPTLGLIWLVGCGVSLIAQWRRLRRRDQLVRRGAAAPGDLREAVRGIAEHMNVRPVEATIVDEIAAPFLWCLGRLRLVWPQAMLGDDRLDRARGVIAHELAHVRRRDHWVAWLEMFAGVIWWWNPLYWFVRSRLRESAEMACDAIALSVCADRREYAEMFLELSSSFKTGAPAPVLGVSTGTPASFERRFTMILSDRVSGKLTLAGALLLAPLAAVALPNWTLAQRIEPAKAAEPTKAVEPTNAVEPTKAVESAKPARQSTDPAAEPNLALPAAGTAPASAPQDPTAPATNKAYTLRDAFQPQAQTIADGNRKVSELTKQIYEAKRALEAEALKLKELEDRTKTAPDSVSEVALLRQEMASLRSQLRVESLTNRLLREQAARARPVPSTPFRPKKVTSYWPVPKVAKTPFANTAPQQTAPRTSYQPTKVGLLPGAALARQAAQYFTKQRDGLSLDISRDPEQQELQKRLLTLDMATAKSAYELAVRDFTRMKRLASANAIASSEMSKKEAELAKAKHDLQRAEIYLQMFQREVKQLEDQLTERRAVVEKLAQTAATAQLPKATAQQNANKDRLRERLQVLLEIQRLQESAYKTGGARIDAVLKAKTDVLAARLELAANAKARKEIKMELIDAAKQLESIAKAMHEQGEGSKADLLKARAFRLRLEADQ